MTIHSNTEAEWEQVTCPEEHTCYAYTTDLLSKKTDGTTQMGLKSIFVLKCLGMKGCGGHMPLRKPEILSTGELLYTHV